jgi:hypothetical protein
MTHPFLWLALAFGLLLLGYGIVAMRYGRSPPAVYLGAAAAICGCVIILIILLTEVIGTAKAAERKKSDDFPPVAVLQDEFHVHPGDPLPKLVPWRGRLFSARYLNVHDDGNGIYSVRFKLERE